MTQRTGSTSVPTKDEIYTCLSDHRRRRLLSILDDRPSPVPETDLAARIVAGESDRALEDVSEDEDETQSVRLTLHHTHLPTLEDAGFVTWDRDAGTVVTTDRAPLDDPLVTAQLESLEESRDRLLSALANRRRRLVLSLASRSQTPIALDDLATSMVARERALGLECGTTTESEAVDRLRTKLYHQHVPELETAGLVAYDRDDETITFVDHPDVETEWFDTATDEPRRAILEIAPPQAKL